MRQLLLLIAALSTVSCGYRIAGKATLLPDTVRTIAVAPWESAATQYKLTTYMAAATRHELIARTRYKLADPGAADAVIYGTIARVQSGGAVLDPATGRATAGQVTLQMQFRLVGKDGTVYLNEPNLEYRQRYEVSTDPLQYLDESPSALQRLSEEAARAIVADILNHF